MKWYISGPITNATREQRDLFYLAEEMVKNLGYDVLNPMRHERLIVMEYFCSQAGRRVKVPVLNGK
jgi:hypothetical protein